MIFTDDLLGGAATFTSSWQACEGFNDIRGCLTTDQVGTLTIQFSRSDAASKTVHAEDATAITASDPSGFDFLVYGPYFRIKYVNGATPQTAFEAFFWPQTAISR